MAASAMMRCDKIRWLNVSKGSVAACASMSAVGAIKAFAGVQPSHHTALALLALNLLGRCHPDLAGVRPRKLRFQERFEQPCGQGDAGAVGVGQRVEAAGF